MSESFHGDFKVKQVLNLLFLCCYFFLTNSCADNLFAEFADETENKAILEDARRSLSKGNYSDAITSCSFLSSEYAITPDAAYVCASAYAGSCGFDLISFINEFGTYDGSTDYLLQFFLSNAGLETAANATACDLAQDTLQVTGVAANRTDDANTLMLLVNLKQLDVHSNVNADSNDDGTVDGGYDSCAISDAEATSYASALWELKETATYTTISGASDISTAIEAACSVLDSVDPNLDFCAAADADTFTADQLRGVRSMISEGANNFGLSDCNTGGETIVECICP